MALKSHMSHAKDVNFDDDGNANDDDDKEEEEEEEEEVFRSCQRFLCFLQLPLLHVHACFIVRDCNSGCSSF